MDNFFALILRHGWIPRKKTDVWNDGRWPMVTSWKWGASCLWATGSTNLKRSNGPSIITDWDFYYETLRQRRRCQLGALTLERFKELLVHGSNVRCAPIPCLALTELELATLASRLNAIMFAFWWSKPLSVQEPVNVYSVKELTGEKVSQNSSDTVSPVECDVEPQRVIFLTTTRPMCWIPLYVQTLQIHFIWKNLTWMVPYPAANSSAKVALLYTPTYPVFLFFAFDILFLLCTIDTEKVEKALANENVVMNLVFTVRKALPTHTFLSRGQTRWAAE